MSRDIVPLGLRMPPDLKEKVESAAKENGRSMNAEIVARLQASFDSGPITPDVQKFIIDSIKSYNEHLQKTKKGMQ